MRQSGILLPVTSLPSPYGVGALGKAAYDFVDFLQQAGQSLWQILPVGPTGYGDSPYQCFSAFAGNPYWVDLDLLAGEGLLEPGELAGDWGADPATVDFQLQEEKRLAVLALAAARQPKAAPEYRAFCAENAWWLEDYALFMALKEAHGDVPFHRWPAPLRRRLPTALKAAYAQYAPRVEFWRCVQYFFRRQFMALRRYAAARGVGLVGDIPIYVSFDSCDLWAQPELFRLDSTGYPSVVAGVPPDAFSDEGQLWGNPLYNWPAHKRSRYAWWLTRLRQASEMFDITRIDHFRGFESYYAVPALDDTAKNGRWVKGPGEDFIRAIHRALPEMQIIAEDLGFLTPAVHRLLAFSGYPGMKVLQFAFDPTGASDYLPHKYEKHTVVYTGTHDNTTTEAWQKEARPAEVRFAKKYLALAPRQSLTEAMIRAALACVADTAVVSIQDWLRLGAEARINTPSTLGGRNWRWRLAPGSLCPALAARIRQETRLYGRLSAKVLAAEVLAVKLEADRKAAAKGKPLAPPKLEPAEPQVLTAAQMRAAEQAATEKGTSLEALMENAGAATAAELVRLAEQRGLAHTALMLCGRGNNAGDAFVAARLLAAQGWHCTLRLLCGEEFSALARLNFERLPAEGALVQVGPPPADTENTAAFIVDGVFGTGFHGGLPKPAAAAMKWANGADGLRVALDVPSGLDCDTGAAAFHCFVADITLTFGAYKPALLMEKTAEVVGQVRLLDIGL